jgi:hypothetical protein
MLCTNGKSKDSAFALIRSSDIRGPDTGTTERESLPVESYVSNAVKINY